MRNGQNRLDAKNDLSAQGAHVSAGNTVALNADGKINLQAAQNTASQTSSNSSSSGSIGISFGIGGANSGLAVTASASKARGNADGNDVTWINTQVSAGNQVTLNSGGDTTIKGAVVAANQVTAKVGGNFAIESPQDTSQYTSQQKSVGGSITAGFDGKVSGSINASKSNIKSDFASVGEQSGIKAGDAGFKVDIANNADLKGGAITSTDKAVQDGKNTFKQGGTLSTSDIQNKADYSASSVGANFGTGFDAAGKLTPQGTSAGIGSDSGTAASTTKAGISGIAGNKDARTTDAQTGIAKIFDASKVQKDIDAQTQITQRFGLEASKAIGDYAATQLQTAKTLRDQAAKESDPTKAQALQSQAQALEKNWGEQGTLRMLAHTAVGGLTGGVSGAAGAATGTLIAPMVAEQLAKAGITGSLAQTLIATASTAAGAAVGGKAGAAAGLNEVANNFLKHDQASALKTDIATCQRKPGGCKDGEVKDIVDKYRALSNQNIVAVQSCVTAGNTQCVQSLESQAASGAEVDAALPFGYGNLASQLATRQNNVKFKGSVNGDSLFGTDLQQAQEVQKFRQDNCAGLSSGACDGLVKQALDDRMTRVGVLMTVGGLTPLAIKGVKALAVPEKAPLTYGANGGAKLDQATIDGILSIEKGARPDPTKYLSQDLINSHLNKFNGGVTKFSAVTPSGIVGPPGGTFVMPKSLADNLIKQAGSDVAKLERLLSLEPGTLGTNPVRIDIPSPSGHRISSGNELGVNKQWVPGGHTSGGIPEAIINPAQPGTYTVKPTF